MASNVILSFDLCQANSCKQITFAETTGAYATNNTSGWNSPNDTSSSTAAILTYSTAGWSGGSATFNLLGSFNFLIGGHNSYTIVGQSTITGAMNALVAAINAAAGTTLATYIGTTLTIISPNKGTIGNSYAINLSAVGGGAPSISPPTGTFSGGTDGATAASLIITDPSSTSFTINLFSPTPNWPTIDDSQLYYIYPITLNQGNTNFIDGLYKFVYNVTLSTGEILSTTKYQFFYCNIRCCVNKMGAKITDPNCDCQADLIAAYAKANALLESLIYQAKAAKLSEFNDTLTVLNRLCTNANCTTCN